MKKRFLILASLLLFSASLWACDSTQTIKDHISYIESSEKQEITSSSETVKESSASNQTMEQQKETPSETQKETTTEHTSEEVSQTTSEKSSETASEITSETMQETTAQTVSLEEIIDNMTLEEKVGQMFFVRCPEIDAVEDIETYHLGGILLFGRDFKDSSDRWLTLEQLQTTIQSYQDAANLPLFIGSDEEGGTVTRASRNPNLFANTLASPQVLYAEGGMGGLLDTTLSYNRTLRWSLGINVNFAPVADVSTNAEDFIYARSFGKDAQETAEYVQNVVETMQEAGIASMLKHFPGYGNNVDTHTGIAIDERTYEVFEESDLLPFRAGIQAGAPFVLVSHNIVTCMDAQYPASLSAKVHELLRDGLGFEGVIVTDDLAMDAVKSYAEDGKVAVLAVLAGNDMIVTTDYKTQIPQVIEAVKDGTLQEREIEEHIMRILQAKQALGLLE